MQIQISLMASVSLPIKAKSAAERERAGLSEVPVILMPTRWTPVKAAPMTKPPTCENLLSAVTSKIAKTKRKVKTSSTTKASR